MNYKKIYDSLVTRGKTRKLGTYIERHHIIPKCMGGSDDPNNIVELTAREHFIAHMLLVKIHPGNHSLVKAIVMMCIGQDDRKLTNRMYEWVRLRFSIGQSISQTGKNNSQFGSKWIHCKLTGEVRKLNINDTLPIGWDYGKYPKNFLQERDAKVKEDKQKAKNARDTEIKLLYAGYYEIYKNSGFDEFVKITGYKKSKPNLVQMFSRHVNEFVPQNGKARCNTK